MRILVLAGISICAVLIAWLVVIIALCLIAAQVLVRESKQYDECDESLLELDGSDDDSGLEPDRR